MAWDLDRDDWRIFRTGRMTPCTPADPRFTVRRLPGGDVSAFVTGRFRGSGGTGAAWPCQGEAILELPASEVVPHTADGIVEPLGPTRCRVITGSWSWTALAVGLGRFDANLHVIGPRVPPRSLRRTRPPLRPPSPAGRTHPTGDGTGHLHSEYLQVAPAAGCEQAVFAAAPSLSPPGPGPPARTAQRPSTRPDTPG
ncbi:hypothetical protein [Streptomyces sp. NPDC001889]